MIKLTENLFMPINIAFKYDSYANNNKWVKQKKYQLFIFKSIYFI